MIFDIEPIPSPTPLATFQVRRLVWLNLTRIPTSSHDSSAIGEVNEYHPREQKEM